MATPRVNQLDINLSMVSDQATRTALDSIVRFVNEMNQGVRSAGDLRGKNLSNSEESAGLKKDGGIFGQDLELDQGGKFCVQVVSGTLTSSTSRTVDLTSRCVILGVFGWTQVNTTDVWRPMPTGSATDLVYITTADGDSNSVKFTNSDANSSNSYYAVIFYRKGR